MSDPADPAESLQAEVHRFLLAPHDRGALEVVARSLVQRIVEGPAPWLDVATSELGDVYARLITQPDVGSDPPVMHTLIANYHSGGVRDVLAKTAGALDATLRSLWESSSDSKNLTLMLMLLRQHLGPWITSEQVSSRHLTDLHRFTLGDLTLPYSIIFDTTKAFAPNRDDLIALATASPSSFDPHKYSIAHLLTFEWLTGLHILRDASSLPHRVDANALQDDGPDESAAAARSFLVNRSSSAATDFTLGHGSPAIRPGFDRLLQAVVAAKHRQIAERGGGADGMTEAALGRLEARSSQALNAAVNLLPQRLSTRRRRRVAPRVAICVSGQLRGYRSALRTWRRAMLRSIDHAVFVHTWERIGRSSAESFRFSLPFAGPAFTDAYREVCLRAGIADVMQRYPTLFTTLTETGTVTVEELQREYRTEYVIVQDELAPPMNTFSNQEKMHSKIEACFEMAAHSGREFDLVVRIRPDKPIVAVAFDWHDMAQICARSSTMFADLPMGAHYANLVIGDQFAVGAPSTMDIYAHTWSTYPGMAASGLFRCPPTFSGHASLAQVCWAHDIDIRKAPIRFGELREAAPMQSLEIRTCLVEDAAGRMDDLDRRLLNAVERDLSGRRWRQLTGGRSLGRGPLASR